MTSWRGLRRKAILAGIAVLQGHCRKLRVLRRFLADFASLTIMGYKSLIRHLELARRRDRAICH